MPQMFISHNVADFTAWKAGFDSHDAERQAHGIQVKAVYQGANDPTLACALFEVASAEQLQAFMANPDVQAKMAQAGVTSPPVSHLINQV